MCGNDTQRQRKGPGLSKYHRWTLEQAKVTSQFGGDRFTQLEWTVPVVRLAAEVTDHLLRLMLDDHAIE